MIHIIGQQFSRGVENLGDLWHTHLLAHVCNQTLHSRFKCSVRTAVTLNSSVLLNRQQVKIGQKFGRYS
jgi:hypothetical protein